MFSYNISKTADAEAFRKVCANIESKVRNAKKEELLIDVDGTLIQIYNIDIGRIKVVNDYEIDAVYVDSVICLSDVL